MAKRSWRIEDRRRLAATAAVLLLLSRSPAGAEFSVDDATRVVQDWSAQEGVSLDNAVVRLLATDAVAAYTALRTDALNDTLSDDDLSRRVRLDLIETMNSIIIAPSLPEVHGEGEGPGWQAPYPGADAEGKGPGWQAPYPKAGSEGEGPGWAKSIREGMMVRFLHRHSVLHLDVDPPEPKDFSVIINGETIQTAPTGIYIVVANKAVIDVRRKNGASCHWSGPLTTQEDNHVACKTER